jgi:hypothetical protein
MKDISPWRDRQLTASGPIETGDVILVPINTAKYVYFKIFGQILGELQSRVWQLGPEAKTRKISIRYTTSDILSHWTSRKE